MAVDFCYSENMSQKLNIRDLCVTYGLV